MGENSSCIIIKRMLVCVCGRGVGGRGGVFVYMSIHIQNHHLFTHIDHDWFQITVPPFLSSNLASIELMTVVKHLGTLY